MKKSSEGSIGRRISAIAFALSLGQVCEAWSADNALPAGDASAGKATVAASCAACHGIEGISRQAGIPHLAGQHISYIQSALIAYRTGTRTELPMRQIAAALSDQDIANVTAYFASLNGFNSRPKEPGAEAAAAAEPDPYAAVKQATATCAGCHGEDGNATVAGIPSLAGQHATYIMLAIKSYLDGSRNVPMMQALVKPLSPSNIEDIAYYFAAMEPHRAATPATGDPYAGVSASAPCAGCHGQDGNNTDPKIPRLAGQDAQYLEAAIAAYKDSTRTHDVMRSQVSPLREQDAKDIAAFYSSKDPKALPARRLFTVAQWTEKCSRCHGDKGNSTDMRFPVLAGQDETYLVKALALYHMGDRSNTLMFAMSFLMSESDIKKLAAYYARQRKE
jgi:cytochrome c553